MALTHKELSLKTASWALTPPAADWMALYEYQSYVSQEFPDVLTFNGNITTLYEIKTSYLDFLADKKKECRITNGKYHSFYNVFSHLSSLKRRKDLSTKDKHLIKRLELTCHIIEGARKTYQQLPHLGMYRYFVCEPDIIPINELPEGWGLFYYQNNKFLKKRDSGIWKPNVKLERDLLVHAFRRFASGNSSGILVNTYDYVP